MVQNLEQTALPPYAQTPPAKQVWNLRLMTLSKYMVAANLSWF